jgi:tRNA dimethylallyltransferase
MQGKIFVVSGPTASGKTLLGIEIAKKFNGVVLNADSCQIYKGLPVLSAQPDHREIGEAEHRLYGILGIGDQNTVFCWLELVKGEVDEIFTNGKNAVIVGGTGMYISRLINGIIELPKTDPNVRKELNELYSEIGCDAFYKKVCECDKEAAAKVNKNDGYRLIKIYETYKTSGQKVSDFGKRENKKFFSGSEIIHINLFPEREVLYRRCLSRFMAMVETGGVIQEVEEFIRNNREVLEDGKRYNVCSTIGFKEIQSYLGGAINKEEMITQAVKKTRNYAKRQRTWFRNQFKNVDFLIEKVPTMGSCENILQQISNKLEK